MKRISAIVLALAAALGAAWVVTPLFLINPFRAQTPARVALGRFLIMWGPWLTLLLLVVGALAGALMWKRLVSWKGRTLTGVALAVLAACAFFGRRSTFETMFHPLPHPEFIQADKSKDVADEDMVLGVQIGDQARAYPVRAMAYHHIVNDDVAGEPIVATY